MFNRNIDLNYDDLLANYHEAMEYISKNSDSFQVISKLRKPYSKLPPNFEHQKIMQSLEPFIEQYFVGIKEWPGTISKDNHTVMIAYRLCPESQSVLKGMPNFLLPLQNNLPNDICFLRNQKPWFATVSHEKIAFAISATKEDILFFREKGIRIYD